MISQKQENLLQLALSSTKKEREKSQILNVGITEEEELWEIIVKYHGNLKFLGTEDIRVEELLSGYAIVTLPKERIAELAALEEIEYLELPKSLIYGVYEAKQSSCITEVEASPLSLTGEGVLLAVIDSGIDYFLEDFRNQTGSRILALWDQSEKANKEEKRYPPEGFLIGVEYTTVQINQALTASTREEALRIVPEIDERGHGTAVTAVAASSNSNIMIRGVAPKAELLIVKMKASKNSDYPATTELMRSITYAVRKAEKVKKPLVINLSFGNTYGPRDGSSLVEQFLNQAAGMGRTTICIGCGNEGAAGGHFLGNIREVSTVEMAIAQRESTTNVQLWKFYEDRFQIQLEAPDGIRFQVIISENPSRQTFLWNDTKVLVYAGVPSPYSSKQEIFFVFLSQENYLDSGIWKFHFQEEDLVVGEIQMYLPSEKQRNAGTRFLRQSPELTITNPATGYGAISVAAYNTVTDSYADFSGRGELFERRNNLWEERNKPDLAAPGVGIMAASVGGGIERYSGTSFAAPMVSGSAALLMEWGIIRGNDPYLYGEKMKAYLRSGAKKIRGEDVYPNNKVGWGALCVERSIPT